MGWVKIVLGVVLWVMFLAFCVYRFWKAWEDTTFDHKRDNNGL